MSAVLPATIATFALASPPAQGDWPQWGRTPQSDAYNGVGPDGGGVEWTLSLEDRVVTSPAVAGGSVYAGTDEYGCAMASLININTYYRVGCQVAQQA